MHHGCYHLCPKVREQLRKARDQAGEEPEEGDSSSDSKLNGGATPPKVQRTNKDASKRSKENSRHPPGAVSPINIVRTPRRSHESAHKQDDHLSGRGIPINGRDTSRRFDPDKRSHRRSQESAHKQDEEYPSGRGIPINSRDTSRRFDPNERSHRQDQESAHKQDEEYPSGRGIPINSRDTSRRVDPDKSHRQSQASAHKQDEEYPSGRGIPINSRDTSRRFDPDERSHRQDQESAHKQEEEYPSGRGIPINSRNTSRRVDPDKSHRQSQASAHKQDEEYPSGRGIPINSRDMSRSFDRDKRSHQRGQDSEQKSPRFTRHGRREPDEYRSGTSSRDQNPHNVPTMKRAAAGKPRDEERSRYEKSRRRSREFDDGAGPSRKVRGLGDFADEFEDDEDSSSAHHLCDSHCRGINERKREFRDERQRKAFDEYLIYKGLPYFGDLCTCCCKCLAKQLWNDNFVMSTVASVALFAVGLKLFSKLDGWTVPKTR